MKRMRLLAFALTLLTINVVFAADEIHWTVNGQNSVTFDWRGTILENKIGYGLTSGAYTTVTATTPNPVPVSSKGPFWEAKLTGLTANTRYYYKIGFGPERSFLTPPAPGSSNFNVYALGNIGSTSTYFNTGAVQDIIANDLPSFVVGLGDLTSGETYGNAAVDQHFNDVMTWSKEAAYMPVWGNQDASSSVNDSFENYKGRFAVPNPQTSPGSPLKDGEDWYWFDYGNVRFITLPEPWTGAWEDWNSKAGALMAEAQADSNIKFIVTFVHRPAYSSGGNSGSPMLKNILDTLGDTYSKYKLNVNAHSRNYERSLPQHGVIHVTAGTGGATLNQQVGVCLWKTCAKPDWSAFRAMRYGALKLRFTGSSIEGSFICGPADRAINDVSCEEGSVVDRFVIGGPVISAVSAFDITQSGAKITWTLSENATGQVEYGTSTSYGQLSKLESSFDYGTHIQQLSDLSPATKYHFRVHSTNQDGIESVSEDFTFTTDTIAPSVPANLTATAVSPAQINLSWNASTDNVAVTGYKVFRNGSQIATVTGISYWETGLAASTTYSYTVSSYDAAGNNSAKSVNVRVTTAGNSNGKDDGNGNGNGNDDGNGKGDGNGSSTSAVCAPAPTSSAIVNVMNTGATGNGNTNDTAAIQSAIDQVGGTGGTVFVPDGTYLIDAVTSLRLKSNMTFRMAKKAILKALPTSSPNYNIIYIKNVHDINVVGGMVQGERSGHKGSGGEWGMGIGIYGARNVIVEGVTAKDAWGDGFYIGAPNSTNVKFCSVVADNNRRQGLSVVDASGVVISGSIFQNTNGAAPEAGVDLEPNLGDTVNDVQIVDSHFLNNSGNGILVAANAGTISNVLIKGNNLSGNGYGYWIHPRVTGASLINNRGQR